MYHKGALQFAEEKILSKVPIYSKKGSEYDKTEDCFVHF